MKTKIFLRRQQCCWRGNQNFSGASWVFTEPSNIKPMTPWCITIISPLVYVFISDLSAIRTLISCNAIFSNVLGSTSLAMIVALSCTQKERVRRPKKKKKNTTSAKGLYYLGSTMMTSVGANWRSWTKRGPNVRELCTYVLYQQSSSI